MPVGYFPLVVAASTLVDGCAGAWRMFGPGFPADEPDSGRINARRVIGAALLAVLVFGLKLPLLMTLGVTPFGVMRLAFVDGAILMPLAGLAVLVAARRRGATPFAKVAAWLGLAAGGVGLYANQVEPFRLQLEVANVPVSTLRAGRSPVRIGVLTDFQTEGVTAYERGAIARLMAQNPDVILMPGDVFQGSREAFDRELPALREALGRLDAPGGVFLVPGDVDSDDRVARIAQGTHIRTLVNQVARVTVGDRRLAIGGVELRFDTGAAQDVVRELEAVGDRDEIRIILGHRPDVALTLRPESRVDLVVAGHTHGGQIVVPFYGPPLTLTRVPRPVAAGGLHTLRENLIYVSRGVGCERGQAPRVRFLCPPEVSLLTLETKNGRRRGEDK